MNNPIETSARIRQLEQELQQKNRELEIEQALETVRSRAMAMQNSDELSALAGTLFTELTRLDFVLTRCVIMIFDPNTNDATWLMANSEAPDKPMSFLVKYHQHPPNLAYFNAWQQRSIQWHYILQGAIKKEWDDFIFSETELSLLPDFVIAGMRAPEKVYLNASFANFGNLTLASLEPLSDEHFNILLRFAKVFDLTYTRFNDLKKAEAQAREARIEAGLERVRSRSLAMHNTSELQEVIHTVHKELLNLDIAIDGGSFISINRDIDTTLRCWGSGGTADTSQEVCLPLYEKPFCANLINRIKGGPGFFTEAYTQEEKKEFFIFLLEYEPWSKLDAKQQRETLESPGGYTRSCCVSAHTTIFIINHHGVPFTQADNDILKRFGKVFEQSYTRFLDLQKAEAQAREATIEAALERVRGKAMAMHTSNDLSITASMVFTELRKLGINPIRCGVGILSKESTKAQLYSATSTTKEDSLSLVGWVQLEHHLVLEQAYDAWLNQVDYFTEMQGEELKLYYQLLLAGLSVPMPDFTNTQKQYGHFLNFPIGCLYVWSDRPYSGSEVNMLKRFAGIIDLTFRRFLELKKAEAQAREAMIEAALEKIRSRSLAMHRSDELKEVVAIFFEKLKELNPFFTGSATIHLFSEGTKNAVIWVASSELAEPACIFLPYDETAFENNPIITDVWNAKETGVHICNKVYSFNEKNRYFEYVFKHNSFEVIPEASRKFIKEAESYTASFIAEKNSLLGADSWTGQTFSPADFEVLKRTARVFEQAYIRFLDLKKAEAQAREAQVEAALERVRSGSLAMHKSNELSHVVKVVFENLQLLGLHKADSINLNIFHEGSKDFDLWLAAPGEECSNNFHLPYIDHPIANDFFASVAAGKKLHKQVYDYDVKNAYFTCMFQHSDDRFVPDDRKQLILAGPAYSVSAAISKYSALFVHNYKGEPFSNENDEIITRFSSVFDQAYKRYLDLNNAEQMVREAVKQASLDRIRGQVAGMRSTSDLQRITQLIWQELIKLNITFRRCGIFIMDEENAVILAYLSTPSNRSLGVLNLPFDSDELTRSAVESWRKKEELRHYWTGADFLSWIQRLVDAGQISSIEGFLDGQTTPGPLHLQFVPFSQGMLYVGSTDPFTTFELESVKSMAEAFSIAYGRYEDFSNLEKAKQSVDAALLELKATQSQLIQAEKMASLGELTAGIAHEIQNPLNFVNNFSDVNKELLEELKAEWSKLNNHDSDNAGLQILQDLFDNEDKINHHGKRADAIVKGMLQHSRTSSGKKEPTNINALAEEYLRLSYHGLRAKSKNFDVVFKTKFDDSIGLVDVVAQDIGRVLLNLYNNAFYAAQPPHPPKGGSKDHGKDEEPTVWVTTSYLPPLGGGGAVVSISVRDNGQGIPAAIVDKIFQPFFTTKPTGQGTGLGLSLSYDIIKAHGGELKVQTKEGDGSEFVIELPA